MLHLQQQLGFGRRQQKFTPLKNYEKTWQRIVSALKQDDYCLVPSEVQRPVRSRKERVEQMMKLYTPLDYREVVQGETLRSYESTKLRLVTTNVSKALLRRQTDCFTDHELPEAEKPAETLAVRPTSAVVPLRRPLSSFQKSKQQQQHPSQQLRPIPQKVQPTRTVVKSQSQRSHQRPFVPPANVTAYAYLVMELPQQAFHITWNSQTQLEVASLTKIMTCMVVLRMLSESKGDLQETVEIGSVETNISGTTAELQRGFKYTIEQLLYGLMLPSGNDASLALAVWGGKLLFLREKKMELDSVDTDVSINNIRKREAIGLFVREMNAIARQIGMKRTTYSNPHGLSNPNNKSTAVDIAMLCRHAMENQQFRKIVACKRYRGTATNHYGECLKLDWQNTNKLLHKRQYNGLKTGFTTSAGSCLASHITIEQRQFIVVVLKCKKLERRFKDTEILKRWVMRKEGLKLRHSPDEGGETEQLELETLQDLDF